LVRARSARHEFCHALALSWLLLAPPAHADKRKARLRYDVAPEVEGCPSEASVRNAVGARLGYDPFDASAAETIAAAIAPGKDALEARVEVRDADGKATGSRVIRSPGRDCAELSEAMTLAISIAIDPLSITRPAPEPPPPAPPPPAACPPCKAPPPCPAPEPEPEAPVVFRASAGALVAFGVAPGPVTGGFGAGAGIRWRALSVGLEGRADIPVTAETDLGVVESHVLLATLVPCGHYDLFSACALLSAGALRGAMPDLGQRDTTFYAAAGVRAALEIPLYDALFGRVHADLQAPLTRTTLSLAGVEAWRTPPVHGAVGFAALGEFR
jgi:hypothetical protein